jgi:ABC-2 type transport system ATP-binding protein
LPDAAVQIDRLTHAYGRRRALDAVTLAVERGEIFGLLGPNGSGKTTLFRILGTLIPPESGNVRVLGYDAPSQSRLIRREIGVVFQVPGLDRQLTAEENLRCHGNLFGLRGDELESRIRESLSTVGLADCAERQRVGTLSGGMRRRVDLAKAMLTRPRLLLLDEPSTGLDPAAKIDLWEYLRRVRGRNGVTVLLTTHLMDEADRCDRLGILDRGRFVACDSPAALKSTIGGDVITIHATDPDAARRVLREQLSLVVREDAGGDDGAIRVERRNGHELVPRIIEALPPGSVRSISVGQPTLEDVFVRTTGHRFENIHAAT